MKKTHPSIAIFDFDETLTTSDSLLTFLSLNNGWLKARLLLSLAILKTLVKFHLSQNQDLKTEIKKNWLRLTLKNKNPKKFSSKKFKEKFYKQIKWKKDVLTQLKLHSQKGDAIIIATGALDLYIYDLLHHLEKVIDHQLKIDHIICTKMAKNKKGLLTGELKGANTVRKDKKDRIAKWIKKHGPFKKITGYGNAPSDLPFLELCDERIII